MTLGHRAAAATIAPSSPTVIAGDTVTLTLNDTILASTPPASNVAAIDLLVTFDKALFALVSVANGTLLVNWDDPVYFPASNLVSIGEGALGDDAIGTGTVVSLSFEAFGSDPTMTSLITVQTAPFATTPPAAFAGEYQVAPTSSLISIAAATVTPPTTVPEPGSIVLLLAPMLAAAGRKRRARC